MNFQSILKNIFFQKIRRYCSISYNFLELLKNIFSENTIL